MAILFPWFLFLLKLNDDKSNTSLNVACISKMNQITMDDESVYFEPAFKVQPPSQIDKSDAGSDRIQSDF